MNIHHDHRPQEPHVSNKIKVLTELAKLTPQELASVQIFVERQRVRKLAKSAEPTRVWGGMKGGWPTPLRSRTTP